jgi:hypothetical protein
VLDAESEVVVDFHLHRAGAVSGGENLDAQEWRFEEDPAPHLLSRNGNVGDAITCSGNLNPKLIEDMDARLAALDIKR